MQALIDPRFENRICQVENDDKTFPVADPLFWMPCPDDCDQNWLLINGEFIKPEPVMLLPTDLSDEQKLALIIEERDKRLFASDWTQAADVIASHDESWNNAWVLYRQALRDMLENVDINNPSYPTPPI